MHSMFSKRELIAISMVSFTGTFVNKDVMSNWLNKLHDRNLAGQVVL